MALLLRASPSNSSETVMTAYQAPIRDMLFAMREIGDLAHVATLPGNEEVSDDLAEAILEEAGKFASDVLAPLNQIGDKEGSGSTRTAWSPPRRASRRRFPPSVTTAGTPCRRGSELAARACRRSCPSPVQEMWKSANMAFSLCPMLTHGRGRALDLTAPTRRRRFTCPRWSPASGPAR